MVELPSESPRDEKSQKDQLDQSRAQRVMFSVSETMVTQYEKYSGWLVTGFAASVALMVANFDRAVEITSLGTVRNILWLFFAAAALQALQRLVGIFVMSATNGAKVGESLALSGMKVKDVEPMLKWVEASFPRPLRHFLVRINRQTLRGDLMMMPRWMIRVAFACGFLALMQALLVLRSIWVLIQAL